MAKTPWGETDPPGGFKIGDRVALEYSDHEEYIFDNPVGVVTDVHPFDPDDPLDREPPVLTVEVQAEISADRALLIERDSTSFLKTADG